MGVQVGGSDRSMQASLVSDMVPDPRLGMPPFVIKSEKESVESAAPLALAPCFNDVVNNALGYGSIYDDVFLHHAAATASPNMVVAPRSGPATPLSPSPVASPVKPRKPDGRRSSAVSLAADSLSPPPERDKPLKKKPRTRSKPVPPETSGQETKQDVKRSRGLERNRIAASKCREKKKQWVHELEATKDDLESRHASLQREYKGLLEEATQIKTSLMVHAACNDHNIDTWIESEAARFVRRSSRQHHRAAALGSRHSSIVSPASLTSQTDTSGRDAGPSHGPGTMADTPYLSRVHTESFMQSATMLTEATQLSPQGLKAGPIDFDFMPDMFGDVS